MIVDVMLSAPKPIQKQLSEAVGAIGRSDFPREWPSLLTGMVEKFASGNNTYLLLRTGEKLVSNWGDEGSASLKLRIF